MYEDRKQWSLGVGQRRKTFWTRYIHTYFKKMERYLRVNLLGPVPRLIKKEFTGQRPHKGWETLPLNIVGLGCRANRRVCVISTYC